MVVAVSDRLVVSDDDGVVVTVLVGVLVGVEVGLEL